MASLGQKWGVCGYLMAGFDKRTHCARCRDKCKGSVPCDNNEDCPHCNLLTSELKLELSTPSYQKKFNVAMERHQPTDQSSTNQTPAVSRQSPVMSGVQPNQDSDLEMDTDWW